MSSKKNATIISASSFTYQRKDLSDEQLIDLYRKILLPRMIEEKMLIRLRQGKLSKWFSGIGQEAVAVGLTAALESKDYILPLHRNLGVFTTRNLPLHRLLAQWAGKPEGYTSGRDRSFHFASLPDRIIGMISHLGAMLPVADGLALASLLDSEDAIAVAFSGDGGTSQGDFHEALNVAAVWKLPVLFVVENNGYGLSTPVSQQFRCEQLADRALGYGIPGYTIDGNNVLEVYHTVSDLAAKMRKEPGPVLLECMTFRMRGHEEASGTKYVPKELMEAWQVKDPVENYEAFLLNEGIIKQNDKEQIRTEHAKHIESALQKSQQYALPEVILERETQAIFADSDENIEEPQAPGVRDMRFVDALQDALTEAMQKYPGLVLMGQDIADYGGVFKITDGLMERFGKERVRNTPLCESAILGAALGLSIAGKKAMVEMQFADFVSCGFNQIVNNLAKTHYRWNHGTDVVVRMPCGGGVGAGPYHSQTMEAWFTHVAGLKVVYPSTPSDAKGLLLASLADPNPIMFFEHKGLYRKLSEPVQEGHFTIALGKVRRVKEGSDISIISYGLGVLWAEQMLERFPDADLEIIDLRTLIPWDKEAVYQSVRKTGKCLVLHEATQTAAFGAEIAASVGEHCFEFLDAPVARLGSLDTPVPFEAGLEKQFLGLERLEDKLRDLIAY